jgi:hypothetical protein
VIALAVLVACGSAPAEPQPAPPAADEAAQPVPAAEPAPAPVHGGLKVIHARVAKGRKLPEHVSATWLGEGDGSALQVMVTGLDRPCEPEPSFSLVAVGDTLRLVEAPFDAVGDCTGAHTLMMQLDGQAARDITLAVVRADGSEFASVQVGANEH